MDPASHMTTMLLSPGGNNLPPYRQALEALYCHLQTKHNHIRFSSQSAPCFTQLGEKETMNVTSVWTR